MCLFSIFTHILLYKKERKDFEMDNMDINKLLSAISKMDKSELEKNIYRAQQILNNSDIKKNMDNQE